MAATWRLAAAGTANTIWRRRRVVFSDERDLTLMVHPATTIVTVGYRSRRGCTASELHYGNLERPAGEVFRLTGIVLQHHGDTPRLWANETTDWHMAAVD